jgi:hypothetical protein
MQLDREERLATAGPKYGALLAHRMMAAEARPPRRTELPAVRGALADLPPSIQDLDFPGPDGVGELSEGELWEVLRRSHAFTTVNVRQIRQLRPAVSASPSTNLPLTHTLRERWTACTRLC